MHACAPKSSFKLSPCLTHGTVQMAALQAVLSITQGQRWALPLPQAATTALTSTGQHAVPGQMLQELQGRALASDARASGVWTDLQGLMLCRWGPAACLPMCTPSPAVPLRFCFCCKVSGKERLAVGQSLVI